MQSADDEHTTTANRSEASAGVSGRGPGPRGSGMVVSVIFRILVSLVILAIGVAVAVGLTATAPEPARVDQAAIATPVITIEAGPEAIARRWRGFGTMRPATMSMVPSRVASTVESLRDGLDVGVEVREGEAIVLLDAEDYQRQMESAAEQTVQIEAEIDRLDSELETAKARLEIGRREVELAERDVERVRDAGDRGAALPREIDAAEQQLLVARRGVVAMEELVSSLPMRRRAMVAQRDQSESARRLAESQVERCRVVAPFDGVVASVLVEMGEQVGAGTPIIRLFDPTRIELPLRIPASARGRVAIGDRVIVNRTVVDDPIEAAVVRVAPEDDAGSRTMTVFVEIDSDGDRVVPGLFVHGEVVDSKVETRAVVPRRSVVNQRLMLVDDGRIRFEPVDVAFPLNEARPSTGLADTQWLVLDEPLPAGSRLVVDGGRSFEEGMSVDPRDPVASATERAGDAAP